MTFFCSNADCKTKRNSKGFTGGSKEDNFFSYMMHCSSSYACWAGVKTSDKKWWADHGYVSGPLEPDVASCTRAGDPSSSSGYDNDKPDEDADDGFTVTVKMQIQAKALTTANGVLHKIRNLIDNDPIVQTCNGDNLPGLTRLSQIKLEQAKKKELWIVPGLKRLDSRSRSPRRR